MESALVFLFPVMIVAVVFFFITIIVYMRHRERMAMIRRGLVPSGNDDNGGREKPEAALRGGIITGLVGLALLLGLLTVGVGPWLLIGLIPMFVGVARIIGYLLTVDREEKRGLRE